MTKQPPHHDSQEPVSESEILIGRIVDGEASPQDHIDFEKQAQAEPSLWRQLALRQQEMAALSEQIERALSPAVATELPAVTVSSRTRSWVVAFAGWAAVIILLVAWSIQARWLEISSPPIKRAVQSISQDQSATRDPDYDSFLKRYLQAPYVLGELDPHILDVEELSDQRLAIRFLRRMEEVAFLQLDEKTPVDDQGYPIIDEAQLRVIFGPFRDLPPHSNGANGLTVERDPLMNPKPSDG